MKTIFVVWRGSVDYYAFLDGNPDINGSGRTGADAFWSLVMGAEKLLGLEVRCTDDITLAKDMPDIILPPKR